MNEICNNLKEIEMIRKSKTFRIIERKNFDRIIISTDELKINWKLRGKLDSIECQNFQEAIKERRKTHE